MNTRAMVGRQTLELSSGEKLREVGRDRQGTMVAANLDAEI